MALLLNQQGDKIQNIEVVVEIIIGRFDKKTVELLLDQQGDRIQITEEVIKAAARNKWGGKKLMKLLLDRRVVKSIPQMRWGNNWEI